MADVFEGMFAEEFGPVRVVGFVVAFSFYLVQYFVILFFNSALVGAAMIRLKGGDPTVGDGFRIAFAHIGSILGYALISATVGIILRWLSERGGFIGRLASSLIGLAWNVATYLVVPVLVVEDVGPIEAIKRSANMLKRTWGEQIVGNFSISTVFGLLIFLVLAAGVALTVFVATATESIPMIVTLIILFAVVVIALGVISSALSGIYSAAVYRYAVEGETNSYFDDKLVSGAFRVK